MTGAGQERCVRLFHGIAVLCLCSLAGFAVEAPAQAPAAKLLRKEPTMTRHIEGTFDVKNTPLAADDATTGTPIGRFGLDKQFHGDLDATSKGEMLSAGDPAKGAAGYVAIEHVTGTLSGHKGAFALQHFGTMEGGSFKLSVAVVPGSASGELAGLAGTMTITIAAGKHSYTFDYTLPAAQ
jgi:hypothetical protein